LPFSGLGAAKPTLRFYADASAATRSAATACSTATTQGWRYSPRASADDPPNGEGDQAHNAQIKKNGDRNELAGPGQWTE
jgi:hypothetical protein